MTRTLGTLLRAAAVGAALVAGTAAAQTINFGIISTDKNAALKEMWEPFVADMSKQTGLKVVAFYATDYTGIIEAQRFNKVQIAWYGNKSAITAVDRANGEVFAQFIDLHGTPGYYSYVITHRDSPIASLDDMFRRGKELSFGSGDPQSTSGTLVPGFYVFSQRGLDAKDVFKVVRPASHGVNLLAVLNKQVDVATNNSEELDKLKLKDPAKREEVRILWTSPLIPRDPLVWRKDLDPAVKAKLKAFVLGYGKDAREKEVLKNMLQIAGFRESTDAQLIPIRQLELAKEKADLAKDTTLSDGQRAEKARAIDARLAELAKLVK
jgi:phosphonate transport system substrate-binding protein